MRWVIARAEGPDCPQVSCSWRWTDDPSWRVAYNGVGMGQAGIVLALDAFADRTGDPAFRAYARAGAAHLRTMTADGARPLPRGSEDDTAETGFLSGSAGAAFMFFERYRHDRDPRDLVTARRLLDWVNEQAVAARSGGLRWPLATDDPSSASGFELGAAGIAWVNLHAARATGDARYLEVARRAAVWLRHAGTAGGAWRETPADASSPVHVGLDSGAAGIGYGLLTSTCSTLLRVSPAPPGVDWPPAKTLPRKVVASGAVTVRSRLLTIGLAAPAVPGGSLQASVTLSGSLRRGDIHRESLEFAGGEPVGVAHVPRAQAPRRAREEQAVVEPRQPPALIVARVAGDTGHVDGGIQQRRLEQRAGGGQRIHRPRGAGRDTNPRDSTGG